MNKLLVFLLLVLIAIVLSGLYGMIHNQISYTVSPEYFTKFKFRQFSLVDAPWPDRVRASVVGLLASWWMGIPIGFIVGACGFVHAGAGRMFKVTLASFAIVVGFTLLFGLAGLLHGWLQTSTINLADYKGWFIPDDIVDLRRFLCAGHMHNASYLGGTLAIFLAAAFHLVVRIKVQAPSGNRTLPGPQLSGTSLQPRRNPSVHPRRLRTCRRH